LHFLTILGGGPAGLGTAFYAHRAGIPFAIYERSAELGGLCRTLRVGEHRYDCGAHRFHDRDADITNDVRSLLRNDLIPVHSPSKIYDRGRFIDFPPTPLNLLCSSSSPRELLQVGIEIVRSRRRQMPIVTFEDFAVGQFGKTLARRLLLNYSEKLWGLPSAQLSPDIATRRLQGMRLTSLFFEVLFPKKKTSHIDGNFLYPRNGYGQIVDSLAAELPAASVKTDHEIVRLEVERGRIRRIHFAARPPIDAGSHSVVSTLPLSLLVKLMGNRVAPAVREDAAALQFRHIRLFFLRLAQPNVSTAASIYIPDPKLCIARLCEPKNRSPEMAPPHETSLVVEVPCFTGDPISVQRTEDLAARVLRELDAIRLIDSRNAIEWRHHFLANAYPVYSLNYAERVKRILAAMSEITNLELLGRGGHFLYSHLHDQLRFGKDCAARFCNASETEPQSATGR
jgi:protoporphyrinogen oxidase